MISRGINLRTRYRNNGSNWWSDISFKDGYFVNNKSGQVLDATSQSVEGTQTVMSNKQNIPQQKWRVEYVDKAEKEKTQGFNEEFGFHINRPFYIRSRLPMRRVAECHGANNVWLKRWRKNTTAQQWYFDGVSKTIRNNHWKSHALDIQSNGGSNNLRCTTSNSRWW